MKLISVQTMRTVEDFEISNGTTVETLMERAGAGMAREILVAFPLVNGNKKLIAVALVGSGKNGGDAILAMLRLAEEGWLVRILLLSKRPEHDPLIKKLITRDIPIFHCAEKESDVAIQAALKDVDIVVDGILGTGYKPPINRTLSIWMTQIGEVLSRLPIKPQIYAVDCPSGVDCTNGTAEECVLSADVTVAMAAVKAGLLNFPAFSFVGRIVVADIGISPENKLWHSIMEEVVDEDMVLASLPKRELNAHKGRHGNVLICGGSIQYLGAPVLAATGAYKVGAGLVRLATSEFIQTAFASSLPEVVWLLLNTENGGISEESAEIILKNLSDVSAFLLGPGLGRDATTQRFVRKILEEKPNPSRSHKIGFNIQGVPEATHSGGLDRSEAGLPSMVIDADGLRNLIGIESWWSRLPTNAILTPHPGEMGALSGLSVEVIQADRRNITSEYAKKWNCVVVLKGALTVIAAPDGSSATIPYATAALAKAGTGDVLSGMITGLLGQGVPAYLAAYAGAWLHAQAGIMAAELQGNKRTPMASDLFESLALVFELLEEGKG